MDKLCDFLGCNNKAIFFNAHDLSCLCAEHKGYWDVLKPRFRNLRLNCGRKKKGESSIFEKFGLL